MKNGEQKRVVMPPGHHHCDQTANTVDVIKRAHHLAILLRNQEGRIFLPPSSGILVDPSGSSPIKGYLRMPLMKSFYLLQLKHVPR